MRPDRPAEEPPPKRRERVKLRLRVTCTAPSEEAGKAWTDFLIRMLKKKTDSA